MEARRLCGLDALGRFGGPVDRAAAADLLRGAARHGSAEAACDLARAIADGEVDGADDEVEGLHRSAAASGVGRSALALAHIVAGRPGSEAECLSLLDAAAEGGFVEAGDAAAEIRAESRAYASRRSSALSVAARVADGLGLGRGDSRSLASRLLGHEDWEALEASLRRGAWQPPDESCPASEVVARRRRQSETLESVLGLHPSLARERVDAIRPTASAGRAAAAGTATASRDGGGCGP